MRAALIILPPAGSEPAPLVLGRSLTLRQLDFARQCKCELLLLLARGVTGEANELRHAAEDAGMRVQLVAGPEALAAIVREDDFLLVMQEDLLPFSDEAALALAGGECVVITDAGAGTKAGFERIDIDRAWGGALLIGGGALRRLSALGDDFAPASALLRIALQRNLPQHRLDPAMLKSGEWQLLTGDAAAATVEQQWLAHMLETPGAERPTGWLAHRLLKPLAASLAAHARAALIVAGVALLALLASLGAAYAKLPTVGLGLLVASALIIELLRQLGQVRTAPFEERPGWTWLRWLLDAALIAVLALAIDAPWFRMLFAPFAVGAGLMLVDAAPLPRWLAVMRDRGVVVLLALAASLLLEAEPAAMALAALLLAANVASLVPKRITQT